MGYKRSLLILILLLLAVSLFDLPPYEGSAKVRAQANCPVNPDARYSRQATLEKLAAILDKSIPEYKKLYPTGFYVNNKGAATFDIYDLVDPANSESVRGGTRCVRFVDRHIYHLYPAVYGFSFSHIVVLEDGNLKVFKSVNCEGRGDTIDAVLDYLRRKGGYDEQTLARVSRYREFGIYTRTDNYTHVKCKEITSN